LITTSKRLEACLYVKASKRSSLLLDVILHLLLFLSFFFFNHQKMDIPLVIVSSLSSPVDSSFATEFVDSYFFPSVAADYCSFMSVAVQATTFLPAAAIKVSSFCPPGVKDFVSLPVAVEECCFLPVAVGL